MEIKVLLVAGVIIGVLCLGALAWLASRDNPTW